jgi:hypothetical protein
MKSTASIRVSVLCLALGAAFGLGWEPLFTPQVPPEEPKGVKRATPAVVEQFIVKLGSKVSAEREAAAKQLVSIGEPALEALLKTAESGATVDLRARSAGLANGILLQILAEGIGLVEKKEYLRGAALFQRAIPSFGKKMELDKVDDPQGGPPLLVDASIQLARAYRGMGAYTKAASVYHEAAYYSNTSNQALAGPVLLKRLAIEKEACEMCDQLCAAWEKKVKEKISSDPVLKKLAEHNHLVLLHSRRYAASGYCRSAYSFVYEAVEWDKHHNFVQVLFDDRAHKRSIDINVLTNQKNQILDLGTQWDFAKDPDAPEKGPKEKSWDSEGFQAVEDHAYLELVRDSHGNHFYVVFKVIALDKAGRYIAFLWHRLPGGKVVKPY